MSEQLNRGYSSLFDYRLVPINYIMNATMAPIDAPMPANSDTSSGSEDIITFTIITAEMDATMAATSTIADGANGFRVSSGYSGEEPVRVCQRVCHDDRHLVDCSCAGI